MKTNQDAISYPNNMTREQWRHELAARAMEGMMCDYIPERWVNEKENITELDIIAPRCYAVADRLLKEGEKDENNH